MMTSQIFKIIYAPKGPAIISTGQIALGFINALKLEGLKDTPSVEDKYYYASTEFPNDDVRISMVYVSSNPRVLVQSSAGGSRLVLGLPAPNNSTC